MTYTNRVDVVPNGGWDERVILCRNGRLVTTCVVVTERAVVMVDTMMNPATARALLDVAREHLAGGRELIVVNTHADFDHAWGNQLFAGPNAEHEAPIVASVACREVFARDDVPPYLEAMRRQHPGFFDDVVLTPPTVCFLGEHEIDGGDLTLRLIPTPGHTVDHVAVHLPEIDTLWAGDAAELPFPMAARGADDLPALRASLDTLAELGAAHVLYCHAPETIGPDLVHENRAYFHALEARCRRAFARGVSADDDDVVTGVGCSVFDVVPEAWRDVLPAATIDQHEHQLRTMLRALARSADD